MNPDDSRWWLGPMASGERSGNSGMASAPFTIPDDTSLRAVFAALDAYGVATEQSIRIWRILTALRGPDITGGTSDIKHRLTEVIRYHVLPEIASQAGALVCTGSIHIENVTPEERNRIGEHCAKHINTALRELQHMIPRTLQEQVQAACAHAAEGEPQAAEARAALKNFVQRHPQVVEEAWFTPYVISVL